MSKEKEQCEREMKRKYEEQQEQFRVIICFVGLLIRCSSLLLLYYYSFMCVSRMRCKLSAAQCEAEETKKQMESMKTTTSDDGLPDLIPRKDIFVCLLSAVSSLCLSCNVSCSN